MCWKNSEPLAEFEPICIISNDRLGFINIHNGYVQSDTPLQRKVTHLYKEMKDGHTMTAPPALVDPRPRELQHHAARTTGEHVDARGGQESVYYSEKS